MRKSNKQPELNVPPQLKNFKNFVCLVWRHLGLPDPTPLQYAICDHLQYGPKRSIVMAFRGCGKSWITSAYVVWELLMDPSKNILVVSASKVRADEFSTFCQRLINDITVLHQLKPTEDQRFS